MDIDLASLLQAVSFIKTAFESVKTAKDLLPAGPQKEEVEVAVVRAERELKLAEGRMASSLNYELCRTHFPPEIMLSSDDVNWTCPMCGNQKNNGISFGAV
ncbi:MAG: hypothetical protein L0332_14255 [Chloroflexi bacterium]|nr:hypothetical protein [Chloroflexota bacterium]